MFEQQSSNREKERRSSEELSQILRMRWLVIGALCTWTALATIAPIILFCFSGNSLSLSLLVNVAPPMYLWLHVTKYYFPIREDIPSQGSSVPQRRGKSIAYKARETNE